MEWLESWQRRRRLRQRLRELGEKLLECAEDPERLTATAREMGMPVTALEAWLEAVTGEPVHRGSRDSGSSGRLRVREMARTGRQVVAAARKDETPGWAIIPRRQALLGEQVRRAVLMLLDLPLAKDSPELVSDLIVQLSQTAEQQMLGESRASTCRETDYLAYSRPFVDMETAVTDLVTTINEAGLPLGEARDWLLAGGLPEALLERGVEQETSQEEPAYLDSEEPVRWGSQPPQAAADVMVVARREREARATGAVKETLRVLPRVEDVERSGRHDAAVPPFEIFWMLEQGIRIEGRSRSGRPSEPTEDAAWTVHEPGAPISLPTRPEKPERDEFLRDLQLRPDLGLRVLVPDTLATWFGYASIALARRQLSLESEVVPNAESDWIVALRSFLRSPGIRDDVELAVGLARAVLGHKGTLTWETCLTLANARARVHRYVDQDKSEDWQVMLDLRSGEDGSVQINFAAVEQPLSEGFRDLFERQDLAGRLTILWHLVRYASKVRSSILSLDISHIERQLALRQDELWQRLVSSDQAETTKT